MHTDTMPVITTEYETSNTMNRLSNTERETAGVFIDRSKEDVKISMAVSMYFLLAAINSSIKTAISFSASEGTIISRSFMLIIVFFMLLSIRTVLQRASTAFIVGTLAILLAYGVSYLMGYAEAELLINGFFSSYFVCFLTALYAYAVDDRQILYKTMLICSYIAIPTSLIGLISLGSSYLKSYSMGLAYAILPFILIQWNEFIDRKKAWNVLLAIAGSAYILVFGNRGALVCIAIFLVIKIFFTNTTKLTKAVALSAIVAFTAVFLFVLPQIYQIITSKGISSYTLKNLMQGSFLESKGRAVLLKHYLELIDSNFFAGYGIWGAFIDGVNYPHNIVVEFYLAFGALIGSLTTIFFLASLFRFVRFKKLKDSLGSIYLVFAAYAFSLFLSGTFLTSTVFYMLIALAWPRRKEQAMLLYSRKAY